MTMVRDDDMVGRDSIFLDRFGWLLVTVLATIVCLSLVDVRESLVAACVTHVFTGAALLLAVRAAGLSGPWRHGADLLVAVTLGFNVTLMVLDVMPSDVIEIDHDVQPQLYWVAAAAFVPYIVARRLLTHREVNVQTVMGAVSAYLQIAVAYAVGFQAIEALTGQEFFGKDEPTTAYMYVSLETITTLGYGDLVPTGELGRLVTVSEAVIGQVFLVTFVALIVTRFAGGRDPRREFEQLDQFRDGGGGRI